MNTMLSGFVSYGATADLGLPEEYGFFCIFAGVVVVLLAGYFLPEGSASEPRVGTVSRSETSSPTV